MTGPFRTQPERTRLAVHRTAATILVVALALVRLALDQDSILAGGAAAVGCVLSLAALATAALLPVGRDGEAVAFPWAAIISAGAVALVALAGLWVYEDVWVRAGQSVAMS